MARPTKQPQFEPPGFHQSSRAKFIKFALTQNSPALRLLGTSVWRGEMSTCGRGRLQCNAVTWLRRVRTDRLPRPPLSALGLVEFASFETQPMGGITYQETYFLEPTAATDESLHFPGLFARMVHF